MKVLRVLVVIVIIIIIVFIITILAVIPCNEHVISPPYHFNHYFDNTSKLQKVAITKFEAEFHANYLNTAQYHSKIHPRRAELDAIWRRALKEHLF